MQTPFPRVLLAFAALAACSQSSSTRRVRFTLGALSITVDSSTGYSIVTQQPVVAYGADSAETYLLLFHYQQAVSFTAGEKPPEGDAVLVVRGGTGTLMMSAYASKCQTYLTTNCVTHFVDPQQSFRIEGYIPAVTVPTP